MSLRALADTLLAVFFAPPCAVCNGVLERPLDGAVCPACWAALQPRPSPFSLRTVSCASAIGPYEATLRDVIHALKYDGRRSIAPRLSALMARYGSDVLRDADLAIPVPLHRRRQRQRGFNQADDLARALGLPVARVLRRVRATQPQVELPAEKRRDNVRDAFAIARARWSTTGRNLSTVTGRVVVLVDDVATTGATLDACAQVLKIAGAKEVRALTAARVAHAPPQRRRP